MADDDIEYYRVKSPTGSITIVPAEIKDVLLDSGYTETGRRSGNTSRAQSSN